ncbi:MAG: RNA polymerase sigma factor [Oscillospiraceae bacterium]|nr:RNA polymerase sigma factor [Oscillospiraceae bacterium]
MNNPTLACAEDGTPQTFEEIYERQFAMVYRVCFSYMKNTADAEDAAADVFAKLLKHGVLFKSAEHEKAWLLRTAINQCKDHLKRLWRSSASIDDYKNLESANTFRESELLKTVLDLPERYKDVIYLYYYEGYSTKEIAQILKKPPSTIRYHMREARNHLKGVLENEE